MLRKILQSNDNKTDLDFKRKTGRIRCDNCGNEIDPKEIKLEISKGDDNDTIKHFSCPECGTRYVFSVENKRVKLFFDRMVRETENLKDIARLLMDRPSESLQARYDAQYKKYVTVRQEYEKVLREEIKRYN